MSQPAPGWFPDPFDPARLRWWDGQRWTTQLHPAARGPALAASAARPPAPGAPHRRTRVATVALVTAGVLLVGGATATAGGLLAFVPQGEGGTSQDGSVLAAPEPRPRRRGHRLGRTPRLRPPRHRPGPPPAPWRPPRHARRPPLAPRGPRGSFRSWGSPTATPSGCASAASPRGCGSSASTPPSCARPSATPSRRQAGCRASCRASRCASPATPRRPTATATAACCATSRWPTAGRWPGSSSPAGSARSTRTTSRMPAGPPTAPPRRPPGTRVGASGAAGAAARAARRDHGRVVPHQGQHRRRRRADLPPAGAALLRRHQDQPVQGRAVVLQ